MTVYLDVFMLMNFLVDLFLLLGTNRLAGFSAECRRIVPGAIIGSLYAAVCMIPTFHFLGNMLWRTVFLAIMGCVAFGLSCSGIRRTGLFLLLSMAMAGVAVGMGKNDFIMLLLSCAAVFILCGIGFGGQRLGRKFICISIPSERETVRLIALIDTGNTLRDPITGESVIVISPESAMKLTGLTMEQIKNPLETVAEGVMPGAKLIPYRSVGNPMGMLLAKRFYRVKIGERECSAVLAFAAESFGEGSGFQALAGGAL